MPSKRPPNRRELLRLRRELELTRSRDRLAKVVETRERKLRLRQLVSLASVTLRQRPRIRDQQLAELLSVSPREAAQVKHAFHVFTQMQVDRILDRFRSGLSLKEEDLARDLALRPDEVEWIAAKAAERIEREIALKKKKK